MRAENTPSSELSAGYRRLSARRLAVISALAALVLLTALLSLCVGSSGLSPVDALLALCGGGDPQTRVIVLSLRLPRVLAAVICGGGLAAVGCAMQAVLRNPLADATTLGVSQGAAFGAAFAIIVCSRHSPPILPPPVLFSVRWGRPSASCCSPGSAG